MFKKTYQVNDTKPNITWKLLGVSILLVSALTMSMLFLKNFAFNDIIEKDDSICEFVTFGPAHQPNLQRSNYWRQIENDVKDLCNIENDAQIYGIGNSPIPKEEKLDDESTMAEAMNTSEQQTDENYVFNGLLEPVPSILISGQEIPNNLLLAAELQFDDELWTIVWEKTVNILKIWQIDAQNIDTLNIQPSILFYETIEKSVLQLLFIIIMDECYQASILQTQINCTDIAFISTMQGDIVKPLLKSYTANETKCAQSKFYIDNFESVQLNGNFDETILKRLDSANIINFEVNLCH